MSKPMIMELIEELSDSGSLYVQEATTFEPRQIQVFLDEVQLLREGAGSGGLHNRVERGRIFADLAGLGELSEARLVSAVISDMLFFLNQVGGNVSQALLDGYADFINEQ